jgi:ribosomal protein L37AE/L43A
MTDAEISIMKMEPAEFYKAFGEIRLHSASQADCPLCGALLAFSFKRAEDGVWTWYCRACHQEGDTIYFVEKAFDVDRKTAVELIQTYLEDCAQPEPCRETKAKLSKESEPSGVTSEPKLPPCERCADGGESRKEGKHSEIILTVDELAKAKDIHRERYLEFFIERGCISILGGEQKIGKSLLALNIGISLARGESFLGLAVPKARKVLYLQQEIHNAGMLERLSKMTDIRESSVRNNLLFFAMDRVLKITRESDREQICKSIEETVPDLVIFDPYCTFHNDNENDTSQMNGVMDLFFGILRKYNIAILLVHHVGKPQLLARRGAHNLRGSSAIPDRADATIVLSRPSEFLASLGKSKVASKLLPPSCYLNVEFNLRHDFEPSPFVIERNPDTLWHKRSDIAEKLVREIVPAFAIEHLSEHGGAMPQKDLVQYLQENVASRAIVFEALREMKPDRIIPEKASGRGNPLILRLR